jgi:hypothetical protein
LRKNLNLIHLGIGSNNITSNGILKICSGLLYHESLISLDLSSYEGLNRNRIGVKGAKSIGNLVK